MMMMMMMIIIIMVFVHYIRDDCKPCKDLEPALHKIAVQLRGELA
jgi:thioredoxin-like negative regulator of GroEL